MGNIYSVYIFINYKYIKAYQGDSLFKAIFYILKAKLDNYGCIKLEYRPK